MEDLRQYEIGYLLLKMNIEIMCVENNIRRGSRNIKDYERGKALVTKLFPDRYEEAIKELADYVGI